MPDYRRSYIEGGTYFFTVVTYKRRPIFSHELNIKLLIYCITEVQKVHQFHIEALVILNDHLHTIWTLPEGDANFPTRWRLIKSRLTYQINNTNVEFQGGTSKNTIWQRGFWEHLIRDQNDCNRHCDYIHYNPVKHGLVDSPGEWKYSSFNDFVRDGFYSSDWGESLNQDILDMDYE